MKALIVREQFRSYKVGDRIDDADTVAAILKSHDRAHVIVTDVSAPPPKPAKGK